MGAEILLLKGNPSRRKSRKRRSSAQRAATRRMLAANRSRFHSNPRKRRKSRKASVAAAPVKRRSSRRSSYRKVSRRRSSGRSFGGSSGIVNLLKTGAIMGGGALAVDVGMGFLAKSSPGSAMFTPINADGSMNYTYIATKGALIWALGKYGTRVTKYAPTMAAGAAAVLAAQVLRSFIPADSGIPMGYFNPGRIAQGGNLGRIMRSATGIPANQSMGRIIALPGGGGAPGASAARTMRSLSGLARR